MNTIILLVFLVYIIGLFLNPKRAFLLYVMVKPLINKNFAIMSSPGLPLLSLDMAICIFTLIYYLAFNRNELRSLRTFPLLIPFYFYLSSLLLSTFFSTIPFLQGVVKSIAYINDDWLFILLFWMIITSKDELYSILRFYVIIFSIMCIYGFIEKAIGYNPVMEFESTLIQDKSKIVSFFYDSYNRLGMGRVQSLTIHPITYGALLAIIMSAYSQIIIHYKEKNTNYLIMLLLSVLFISNILFTNSRAPLVFLIIAFTGVLNFSRTAFIRFWIPIILIITFFFFINIEYIKQYSENFYSLLNVRESSVGGSDLGMRISQYMAAFDVFRNHMVFGLGIGSLQDIFRQETGIIGAESVWISIIIEQGILGVFCYLVLIVYLYKNFRIDGDYVINKFFFFLITAWLIFAISTGEMFTRNLFFTVILIIYQLFSEPAHKVENDTYSFNN